MQVPCRRRSGLFTSDASHGDMKREILTRRDALRHTGKRIAIAVGSTAVSTPLFIAICFGTDPDAPVRLGTIAIHILLFGTVISATLTGALAYRSSVMMQELNRTRTELLRVSHTDQLTGLLNRRGYNEAALQA